jgi:hypothetical protein
LQRADIDRNIPRKAILSSIRETNLNKEFAVKMKDIRVIKSAVLTSSWHLIEASGKEEVVLLLLEGTGDVLEGVECLLGLVEEVVEGPHTDFFELDFGVGSVSAIIRFSLACSTAHLVIIYYRL